MVRTGGSQPSSRGSIPRTAITYDTPGGPTLLSGSSPDVPSPLAHSKRSGGWDVASTRRTPRLRVGHNEHRVWQVRIRTSSVYLTATPNRKRHSCRSRNPDDAFSRREQGLDCRLRGNDEGMRLTVSGSPPRAKRRVRLSSKQEPTRWVSYASRSCAHEKAGGHAATGFVVNEVQSVRLQVLVA